VRSRQLHIRDIELLRTNGAGWNDFRAELASVSSEPWFRLTRLPADLEEMNDANRPGIERWIAGQRRAWIEPSSLWERITCPVLVQIGTRDRLVPPGPSRDVIRAALARAGNTRGQVRLYEGGDHGLFESPTGFASDIPKVTRMTPGYLTDLSRFIRTQVTGPAAPRSAGCGRRSS
jgi:pimeloyl-ACP methyl ester carboxylesterase